MPGARCTRGLVCKIVRRNAHEHTGSAEAVRHSLRNGFTAYAVLSPATNSFCHRRQRIKTCPSPVGPTHLRWLDISNGCQDHTVLPYATSAVRPARREPLTSSTSPCDHLARRRCRVHRIPSRVRDDGQRPSCRGRMGRVGRTDLPDGESEIFFAGGLDGFLSRRLICPSGRFVAPKTRRWVGAAFSRPV